MRRASSGASCELTQSIRAEERQKKRWEKFQNQITDLKEFEKEKKREKD